MKALILALCLLASPALAKSCIEGDKISPDKAAHFVGTAGVSTLVTALTDDPLRGFLSGLAIGAARELQKQFTGGMRCEWSSMTYDLVGSSVGTFAGYRFFVIPKRNGAAVGFVRSF